MRLFDGNNYERTYYVCFRKADKWSWWHIFTGKKYAHCASFTPLVAGNWLFIDPTSGGIFIIEYLSYQHIINDLTRQFQVMLEIKTNYDKLYTPRAKGILTCVSVIKNMLGIKKWWIVTPKQLMKELYKNGRIIWRS